MRAAAPATKVDVSSPSPTSLADSATFTFCSSAGTPAHGMPARSQKLTLERCAVAAPSSADTLSGLTNTRLAWWPKSQRSVNVQNKAGADPNAVDRRARCSSSGAEVRLVTDRS